jgi:hypothetical protein
MMTEQSDKPNNRVSDAYRQTVTAWYEEVTGGLWCKFTDEVKCTLEALEQEAGAQLLQGNANILLSQRLARCRTAFERCLAPLTELQEAGRKLEEFATTMEYVAVGLDDDFSDDFDMHKVDHDLLAELKRPPQ